MGELCNALARGVYSAYPLFGMRETVLQEAVKSCLHGKMHGPAVRRERGGYGLQ